MSKDNFDKFWAELNRPQSRRTRVYYSLYRKFHVVKDSPKAARRKIRHWTQRARRGWSDQDTWSFDHHLSGVISGGVRRLQADAHGYPVDVCSCPDPLGKHTGCDGAEKWNAVLEEIAQGFELQRRATWSTGTKMTEEEQAKMDRAFDLLKLHYGSLWD